MSQPNSEDAVDRQMHRGANGSLQLHPRSHFCGLRSRRHKVLEGASRLVQSSSRVRTFLPHTLWVFILFFNVFLVWWASWEFRVIDWTFAKYSYFLVAPTLFYLACSLVLPEKIEGDEINLERHFFRIRRLFFGAYFFAALATFIDGNVLSHEAVWHTGRIGHLLVLSSAVVGYLTQSRSVHLAVATVTLLAILGLAATRFLLPR